MSVQVFLSYFPVVTPSVIESPFHARHPVHDSHRTFPSARYCRSRFCLTIPMITH